jgi:hypothetical protein
MVKVLTLRRRQGGIPEHSGETAFRSRLQNRLILNARHTNQEEEQVHSSTNIVEPVSSPSQGSSLRGSSQLGSSLRSSSQVSTLNGDPTYQLQLSKSTEESADIEKGLQRPPSQKSSTRTSLSAPASMDTVKSSDKPPSIVSWHAGNHAQEAHTTFLRDKRDPSPNQPHPNSPQSKTSIRSSHPLDNAIIIQPSELTHTSSPTTSPMNRVHVLEERWGIPSDFRALPLYLMPLALMPMVCLVGGLMVLVLIGIVIESYF